MIVILALLPKPNVLVINQTVSQQLSHGQVPLLFISNLAKIIFGLLPLRLWLNVILGDLEG